MPAGCLCRSRKAQGLVFVLTVVVMLIIMGYVFADFLVKKTIGEAENEVHVRIEISDSGRELLTLLSAKDSSIGINHMEIISSSSAQRFDDELIKHVTRTAEAMELAYIKLDSKEIFGHPPLEVFTTQIPLPGAGKSGKTRAEVSIR